MIPRNTLVHFYEDEDRRRIYLTGEEIEDDLLDANQRTSIAPEATS